MKKKTIVIEVYDYSELSESAQNTAKNNLIKFILYCYQSGNNFFESVSNELERAIKKSEEMKTPWFVGEYFWEYAEKGLLDILNADEYLQNGKLFRENN